MAERDLQMEQGKRKGVLSFSHTMAHGKCPSRSPEWVETIGLELPLEELSSHSHGGKVRTITGPHPMSLLSAQCWSWLKHRQEGLTSHRN